MSEARLPSLKLGTVRLAFSRIPSLEDWLRFFCREAWGLRVTSWTSAAVSLQTAPVEGERPVPTTELVEDTHSSWLLLLLSEGSSLANWTTIPEQGESGCWSHSAKMESTSEPKAWVLYTCVSKSASAIHVYANIP